MRSFSARNWPGLLIGLAAVAGGSALAASPPAPADLSRCQPPAPGLYAVLGSGEAGGEPTAVLMQERWMAGGRIEGVRYLRQGRRFSEDRYTGMVKVMANCWAVVERQGAAGATTESSALDSQGRPRVGLQSEPAAVLSVRYVAQGEGICRTGLLDGLVTSQQQGQSWSEGRWRPNAVVQREWWQAGAVQGWAVSSYGGRMERAGYSGRLELKADCTGRMAQRDGLGNRYDYGVIVLAGGGGYFYLQSDPDNLTLGLLQRTP